MLAAGINILDGGIRGVMLESDNFAGAVFGKVENRRHHMCFHAEEVTFVSGGLPFHKIRLIIEKT